MLVAEVVVGQIVNFQFRLPVRLIINAQAAFFLNSVALIIEIRLVHDERLHSIGFEEQTQIELVLRQSFKIVSSIFVGGPIGVATIVLDQDEVFAFAYVF